MIDLIILGGSGRMGQAISRLTESMADVSVKKILGSSDDGYSFTEFTDSTSLSNPVLIDFSLPGVIDHWLPELIRQKIPVVSGVTGMSQEQQEIVRSAGDHIPVLWGSNMSIGIQLLQSALAQVARWNSPETPVHLLDVHHRAKRDAPSGTAISLAHHWLNSSGMPDSESKQLLGALSLSAEQDCLAGAAGPLEFTVRREGDVIGDHALTIQMDDETLTLGHHAENRDVFARGAIHAAQWLSNQSSGYYLFADLFRVE